MCGFILLGKEKGAFDSLFEALVLWFKDGGFSVSTEKANQSTDKSLSDKITVE